MMEKGDGDSIRDVIEDQLIGTISFHDSAESFYHGFMVGLLKQSKTHIVKSNRESGNGRGDIFVYTPNIRKKAYVLELKASKDAKALKKDAERALEQISEKNYAAELKDTGYSDIEVYGIAFYRKNCEVMYGGKI